MARIRTVKPEFWTAEQIMELSRDARLLFIGMWNFCDDRGVHPAAYKTLKAEVFPGDDITSTEIQSMVSELLEQKLIVEFEQDNRRWWHVTGWKHQIINRPSASRYPKPPHAFVPQPLAAGQDDPKEHDDDPPADNDGDTEFDGHHAPINDGSRSDHGGLTESSRSPHGAITEDSLREGKGRERKVGERKDPSLYETPLASQSPKETPSKPNRARETHPPIVLGPRGSAPARKPADVRHRAVGQQAQPPPETGGKISPNGGTLAESALVSILGAGTPIERV